ncbi:KAP family P-loop NTPase fold protein [Roseobacter sp. MH60115]|uniref:KAP family P-loop NTPase fold protein n=1 Tax=Roseobacter sp. MH60115 TaxID=2785324 RepID=UPI0018A28E30|nr:P-loop NTPase fold protein [Roseobacter sp. MH60115]
MRFLPPEPIVDLYNEGFEEPDILKRKPVSEALSALTNRINDPLVIAIDGKWGSGKSYFLKRWVGAHTLENEASSVTVYFDAFAQDFVSDPLPALLAALEARVPAEQRSKLQAAKEAAFKLVRPISRIGLSLATFGAMQALDDVGDAVAEAVSGEAARGIDTYWEEQAHRQTAMSQFRSAIEALAESAVDEASGASLIFVVDELDRCRPDYALEVLEIIKHFFSIPRVHFVLGVNLEALQLSVAARYGDKLDAAAYLQKFIQIRLALPNEIGDRYQRTPAIMEYAKHLIEQMEVPQHLAERLKNQLAVVAYNNRVSMRDVGKIVSSLMLANNDVLTNERFLPGWLDAMIDLVIAQVIKPDLFPKMLTSSCSDFELVEYFGATDDRIGRDDDARRSRSFDHDVYWRYRAWQFFCNDGVLGDNESPNEEDRRVMNALGESLDRFRSPDDVKKIPQKVYDDWLNLFRLHS